MPRRIAAGNWKMNGLAADMPEAVAIARAAEDLDIETILCPPATLLAQMRAEAGRALRLGCQTCHPSGPGAHTGDLSAAMLADAGAAYCITGHSERRADHGETNDGVAAMTRAAWDAGLTAILCIGETLEQRDAGRTLEILAEALDGSLPDGATADNTVIAYEPVWAIGTGRTATPDQVAEVHDALRARTGPNFTLLYGGSVKAGNAADLFTLANVNGALVGGASLKAEDFVPIMRALAES